MIEIDQDHHRLENQTLPVAVLFCAGNIGDGPEVFPVGVDAVRPLKDHMLVGRLTAFLMEKQDNDLISKQPELGRPTDSAIIERGEMLIHKTPAGRPKKLLLLSSIS